MAGFVGNMFDICGHFVPSQTWLQDISWALWAKGLKFITTINWLCRNIIFIFFSTTPITLTLHPTHPDIQTTFMLVQFGWNFAWRSEIESRMKIQSLNGLLYECQHPIYHLTWPPQLKTTRYVDFANNSPNFDEILLGKKSAMNRQA